MPVATSPEPARLLAITKRQKLDKYRHALRNEYYNGWREHHQEIADVFNPRRPRFLTTDRYNAGRKKNSNILNNVTTEASGTLRAGLMSGTASPARPWFRLSTHNVDLNEDPEVKAWLAESEKRVYGVISKSNFYPKLEESYGDLGDFGTAAFFIEEDPEETIRCFVFPIGSYFCANSPRGDVDTIFRETQMTTSQLVGKFGYRNCSPEVQRQWDMGELYGWHDVIHYMGPNDEHEKGALGWRGKKWASHWYEANRPLVGDDGGFLRLSGYDYKPFMVVRWTITDNDVFGSSPGMNALGDARGLQHLEEQKLGVVDKHVNPPLNIPSTMRGQQASLVPGAENYTGTNGGKIEPAIVVDPRAIEVIENTIRQHEARIRAAYFADLFRLLDQFERGQMTAYEVQQRIQEKMQLIGPAYDRTEDELLDPCVSAILHIMFQGYMLPPVPRQLAGQEIKIEYTSIIAQAQRAAGTGALRELLQLVGNLAAVDSEVVDNIDFDAVVREYANMLGIPPKLLHAPEVVAAIRQAKQQMLAKQQQQAQMQQMAAGAKVLSETDTEGKNALTDMLQGTGRV